MDTIHQPPDTDEPRITPYFAAARAAVDEAAARRGLPPEPWTA